MEKEEISEESTVLIQMSEDLRKIREALVSLEKSGIAMEVLEIYIQRKTRMNLRDVRNVLAAEKDFFKKALKPAR